MAWDAETDAAMYRDHLNWATQHLDNAVETFGGAVDPWVVNDTRDVLARVEYMAWWLEQNSL